MAPDVPRVLVIDDEPKICRNCLKILSTLDVQADSALNGYDALKRMAERPYDVIVTDLKMSRLGGMEVLRQVSETHPDTLVIVITGFASVSSAVEVMKMGAFDYLPKPFTPEELRAVVRQAVKERFRRLQNRVPYEQAPPHRGISHQLVGKSPKIQKVIDMVRKVSPTDATVLLYGESGTGKELIARAIHVNSRRQDRVFFALDCGTLSGNLLETELFGHVKGAFTGADQSKDGIFSHADGGTVFLDEISNTSMGVQAKLLRFLETRDFLPLGSTQPRSVDVRLIFATNQRLQERVEAGEFRQDFYYRIFVYPISIPPLRERKEDILPIAHHFLKQYNQHLGKAIAGISTDAAVKLTAYDWPGNVRQLKNIIERAVILCERPTIGPRDLPFADALETVDTVPATNDALKALKKRIRREAVMTVEKNFLLNALMQADWNISQAARNVGLQRTNFQAMMKKHGIRRPGKPHRQP
jgi:DNA-binding NtrC family response regulator